LVTYPRGTVTVIKLVGIFLRWNCVVCCMGEYHILLWIYW